ncbi:MAG: nucleotide exchange factor GrpE [Campylobacteraceae bacterium]|nr:nucleotide exchange factor GrpE [Campylobacteraceae bacterium]
MSADEIKNEEMKNLNEAGEFNGDEIYGDEVCENETEEESEISKLEAQISELTDKFYRANADFDNMKKRLEKEKLTAVSYAGESFAKDMLPIIDALEAALSIDVGDNEFAKNIKDGVQQCVSMVLNAFEKNGITQVSTDGKFDPNVHNAIQQVEDETKESGDIYQVYQKGYLYKERVLRPAMVVVVK